MSLLTDEVITRELGTLPGWTKDGNAIRKQFTFKGFPEAVPRRSQSAGWRLLKKITLAARR